MFTAVSPYLGPTLPMEQRSHLPLFPGHDGWDSDITSWRESCVMDWLGEEGAWTLKFQSWLCYELDGYPWASCFASLGLGFLTYQLDSFPFQCNSL